MYQQPGNLALTAGAGLLFTAAPGESLATPMGPGSGVLDMAMLTSTIHTHSGLHSLCTACGLSTWETEAGGSAVQTIFSYGADLKPACDI